jgi:hypothetical protein
MTVLKDDPCAAIILDFIAGGVEGNPVGETKGNYNAYFGHVASTEDLSLYTIAGIYGFQAGMLSRDKRSSAVGRYQFLRKTLQDLQAELNLASSEVFSQALQDRLAMRLLERRGYGAWRPGHISDEEFAHRLSMEWASLPDPDNDGRSHYDGDSAGNHASTSITAVYAMLQRARGAMDNALPAETAPATPPSRSVPAADASAAADDISSEQMQAAIMNLQLGLRLSGDYDSAIDGIAGAGTKAALQAFLGRL